MKIAVISDTHGLVRPEVIEIIKHCDAALHAGDVGTPDVLEELSHFLPLYVVKGNNDKEWAKQLPLSLRFELDGVIFFMVHDKKDIPRDLHGADVVVFGHSHQYWEEKKADCLCLNPGSCGRRRFRLPVTMAIVETANGSVHVRRIDIE